MAITGTLGFLGFGNMGRAIANGLVERGAMNADAIMVFDIDEAKRAEAMELGMSVADSAQALSAACDSMMIAVKPQSVAEVMDSIAGSLKPGTLLISICAGISNSFYQEKIGADLRVIRVMPNTPALVGAGAAAISPNENCSDDDILLAKNIFDAVGLALVTPESTMDAVTALSGSGPAYFFYMVECLVKAAAAEGLSERDATELAGQTLLGAGKLLCGSGESADVLRERVTSKGGTTAAALRAFMEKGFEQTISAGVAAAAARSRELGR